VVGVDELVGALDLDPAGEDQYVAHHAETGHAVVFGGQLMAQSLVAAGIGNEDKAAKTLHIVFARAARPDLPLEITVDRMHAGRAFASSTVTISQGDRLCTRAIVLLTAAEPDFISHADPAPEVAPPTPPESNGDPALAPVGGEEWEVVIVDDVDISDPDEVGPPDLDAWSRFPGAPADPGTSQALLAFATDGFLIGTAMRPHAGVGQSQAHVTLSTGVISHTLTFHDTFDAADWLLLSHHSPHAGGGRSYGRADVFRSDGALVASYVQDAMIRPMNPEQKGPM
jgi:acyl-CoA thioesterase II